MKGGFLQSRQLLTHWSANIYNQWNLDIADVEHLDPFHLVSSVITRRASSPLSPDTPFYPFSTFHDQFFFHPMFQLFIPSSCSEKSSSAIDQPHPCTVYLVLSPFSPRSLQEGCIRMQGQSSPTPPPLAVRRCTWIFGGRLW